LRSIQTGPRGRLIMIFRHRLVVQVVQHGLQKKAPPNRTSGRRGSSGRQGYVAFRAQFHAVQGAPPQGTIKVRPWPLSAAPARRRPAARAARPVPKSSFPWRRVEAREEGRPPTPVARRFPRRRSPIQHFPKRPSNVDVGGEVGAVPGWRRTLAKIFARELNPLGPIRAATPKVPLQASRGKQLLPEHPAGGRGGRRRRSTFLLGGGLLRALIVNFRRQRPVSGWSWSNDSEKEGSPTGKGQGLLLGELGPGPGAVPGGGWRWTGTNPSAHLNMGIALQLKGDRAAARTALEAGRSAAGPPHGGLWLRSRAHPPHHDRRARRPPFLLV